MFILLDENLLSKKLKKALVDADRWVEFLDLISASSQHPLADSLSLPTVREVVDELRTSFTHPVQVASSSTALVSGLQLHQSKEI
ncbi:MAG: hypothetical protein LH660_04665 [Phormidesmis sp. CAN_BIN36]|nr:hypothetical protein [Phormidesmis sp. CAN_BIN36]